MSRPLVARVSDGGRVRSEDGYKLFDGNDLPYVKDAIQAATSATSGFDWEGLLDKQPFRVSLDVKDISDPRVTPIFQLACSDWLVAMASEYIGSLPVVNRISLWYSPQHDIYQKGRSQDYHFDSEDKRQLKFFFFLDEIDDRCGPTTIIPAAQSQAIQRKYLAKTGDGRRLGFRYMDEEIESILPDVRQVEFVGPRGTIGAMDATRCLHRGNRPPTDGTMTGRRFMLLIHYTSAFSRMLPVFHRSTAVHLPGSYSDEQRSRHTEILGSMTSFYNYVYRQENPDIFSDLSSVSSNLQAQIPVQ